MGWNDDDDWLKMRKRPNATRFVHWWALEALPRHWLLHWRSSVVGSLFSAAGSLAMLCWVSDMAALTMR